MKVLCCIAVMGRAAGEAQNVRHCSERVLAMRQQCYPKWQLSCGMGASSKLLGHAGISTGDEPQVKLQSATRSTAGKAEKLKSTT